MLKEFLSMTRLFQAGSICLSDHTTMNTINPVLDFFVKPVDMVYLGGLSLLKKMVASTLMSSSNVNMLPELAIPIAKSSTSSDMISSTGKLDLSYFGIEMTKTF